MTLGFSTQINGKPNHFVEKILSSLADTLPIGWKIPDDFEEWDFDIYYTAKPKHHTIREDKSDRWKAGKDIHFVIHNRTPQRFQFAPVVKCVSVQRIEILELKSGPISSHMVKIDGKVKYDGLYLLFHDSHQGDSVEEYLKQKKFIERLAINDGFDSVEDFFAYFNKDFTGKIIHWTNLKY